MNKSRVLTAAAGVLSVLAAAKTPCFAWTWVNDPVITAGQTRIRAVHFTELRAAIDSVRSDHSLPAYSWTGSITAGASPIRTVHIAEMRTAILDVYNCSCNTDGVNDVAAPIFANATLTPGATHIRGLCISRS